MRCGDDNRRVPRAHGPHIRLCLTRQQGERRRGQRPARSARESAMIVAGIGCRKGATAAQVAAAVAAALERAGLTTKALSAMATPAAKGGEPGITSAARALHVPLVLVPQAALEAAGRRATTRSERVVALWKVPSVAEAAALAAGGPTARLRVARCAVGPATCALADTEAMP